jgi:uncharacterized protein YkwD
MRPRAAALAAVCLLAVPGSAAAQCDPEHGWGPARHDFAPRVVQLVNEHRASIGQPPLAISRSLTRAAIWKSRHLNEYDYFDHDDQAPPVARSFDQRFVACGSPENQAFGENIAHGDETPESVVRGWLDSPGHRENIESPDYTAIGLGESNRYWTQTFGSVLDEPNAGPQAVDDTASARGTTSIEVLANDTDEDIDWAYVESVEQPGNGTATLAEQSRAVNYAPNEGFAGQDSFSYTLIDIAGERSTATVTVEVTPNSAPRAVTDVVRLGRRTTRKVIAAAANDTDADGDPLSVTAIVKAPKRGSAKVKKGRIVYKPSGGRVRRDALTYRVSDGHGGTDTARVKIRPKR